MEQAFTFWTLSQGERKKTLLSFSFTGQVEMENYGKSRRLSSKANIPFFSWIFRGMEAQTLEEKTESALMPDGLG